MKRALCAFMAFFMLISSAPVSFARVRTYDVSDEGVEFIKRYEGFSQRPYLDNGVWRVGYGSQCTSNDYPNGITERKATQLLADDLEEYAQKVNDYIRENDVEVDQSGFDALVSFTYNLGSGWMDTSYKFSGYLVNGLDNYDEMTILDAYVVWCHVGQRVDKGLVSRRLAEAMLILHGDYDEDSADDYTYAVVGGNGGEVESDIKCFRKGDTLGDLYTAERKGYVFAGWFDNETNRQIKASDTIEEPMEISAKWFLDVQTPFVDVKSDSWYYRYVGELYSKRVINGMTPTTFQPSGNVTYGQALKLLLLATGLQPSNVETGGHWAQKYKDMAVDEGLIPSDFAPNLDAPISRQEIAAIAAPALGLKSGDENPFSDTSDSDILALYEAGIVEGTTESDGRTYFYPQNSITRAEISTIIWRVLSYYESVNSPGQIQYGSHTINVLSSVKKYTLDDENYYTKDGFLRYRGKETYAGIDVSSHQGEIDWQRVKRAGVDFAFIRVGGRGYGAEGNMYDDAYFERNIEGALDAGINVGIYYFSQAISEREAEEEADYVLEHIKGYDITYPVVFDWERVGSNSRTNGLDTDTLCRAANKFCSMIEAAGYKPMVYFNSDCGYLKYDLSRVNQYDFWYARYNDTPGFYYDFQIWQYSDSGTVDGINGRVDMDISFVDYSKR